MMHQSRGTRDCTGPVMLYLALYRYFVSSPLQEGKRNIKLAADIYGLVVNASVPDIYMLAFFLFLILD
jgi:hypothetical protein